MGQTKEDAIAILQGNWVSTDGRLAFTIKDERITNIVSDTGIGTSDTFYTLNWFEPFKRWQIGAPRFVWIIAYINKLSPVNFQVYSFQKGANDPILVIPETLELIDPDFVFDFIRG